MQNRHGVYLTCEVTAISIWLMSMQLVETTCPHYVESTELLRAAEQSASEGQYLGAGCWWKEAVASAERITNPVLRKKAQFLAGECLERLAQNERARNGATECP